MEDLVKRIQALNDYSDQKEVREIYAQIQRMNTNDPKTKVILELARSKGMGI